MLLKSSSKRTLKLAFIIGEVSHETCKKCLCKMLFRLDFRKSSCEVLSISSLAQAKLVIKPQLRQETVQPVHQYPKTFKFTELILARKAPGKHRFHHRLCPACLAEVETNTLGWLPICSFNTLGLHVSPQALFVPSMIKELDTLTSQRLQDVAGQGKRWNWNITPGPIKSSGGSSGYISYGRTMAHQPCYTNITTFGVNTPVP